MQGGSLNDRQRTILGVIAVFSLVAIASLSFVLMNQSGNIQVAADIEPPKQCINNQEITANGLILNVSTESITINNTVDAPDEQLKITLSDVTNPRIVGYNADFRSGVNIHQTVLDLGARKAGEKIVILFAYSASGNLPCVQVAVSADGIAFSPEVAVSNLQ